MCSINNYSVQLLLRRLEYLKKIGNQDEIDNCRKADQGFISLVEEFVMEGSLKEWKTKVIKINHFKRQQLKILTSKTIFYFERCAVFSRVGPEDG